MGVSFYLNLSEWAYRNSNLATPFSFFCLIHYGLSFAYRDSQSVNTLFHFAEIKSDE